jgi:hypothetical protein
MLNPPRLLTPFYFAARFWAARLPSSTYVPSYLVRWGGHYFGSPYFEDPYFIRRNPTVGIYTPRNLEKWGGNYFGSGYFEDHYFVTGIYAPNYAMPYWPQWLQCTRQNSVSLLGELFGSLTYSNEAQEEYAAQQAEGLAKYNYLSQPIIEYNVHSTIARDRVLSISITADTLTIIPEIVRSLWAFQTHVGPCAYVEPNGLIRLRNLAYTLVECDSNTSGVVTLPKAPTKDSIIWADAGVYYQPIASQFSFGGQTSGFVGLADTTFSLWFEDPDSVTALDSATCRINSGPSVDIKKIYIKNDLDALGEILSLKRFQDESNLDMSERFRMRTALRGAIPQTKLVGQIAIELGLCSATVWATSGTATITSGTAIHIVDLPETSRFQTLAQNLGYTSYGLGVAPDILYLQYNGRVRPAEAVSGLVTVPVSGGPDLPAFVQVSLYSQILSGELITGISATRNTPLNEYLVLAIQGVQATKLSDVGASDLYTAAGGATSTLKTLTDVVDHQISQTYGSAPWSGVHWFEVAEIKPEMDFLPEETE